MIIAEEVLGRSGDFLCLYALDDGDAAETGERWVFRERFEAPSASEIALNVAGRTEDDVYACALIFMDYFLASSAMARTF